jgi:excisionase family DNA binding protein
VFLQFASKQAKSMNNELILSTIPIEDLKSVITDVVNNAIAKSLQGQSSIPEDEFLTRKQTATKFEISLPTLDKYTTEGKITGYRIGTRIRYKKAEIEKALRQIGRVSRYKSN